MTDVMPRPALSAAPAGLRASGRAARRQPCRPRSADPRVPVRVRVDPVLLGLVLADDRDRVSARAPPRPWPCSRRPGRACAGSARSSRPRRSAAPTPRAGSRCRSGAAASAACVSILRAAVTSALRDHRGEVLADGDGRLLELGRRPRPGRVGVGRGPGDRTVGALLDRLAGVLGQRHGLPGDRGSLLSCGVLGVDGGRDGLPGRGLGLGAECGVPARWWFSRQKGHLNLPE